MSLVSGQQACLEIKRSSSLLPSSFFFPLAISALAWYRSLGSLVAEELDEPKIVKQDTMLRGAVERGAVPVTEQKQVQ